MRNLERGGMGGGDGYCACKPFDYLVHLLHVFSGPLPRKRIAWFAPETIRAPVDPNMGPQMGPIWANIGPTWAPYGIYMGRVGRI